MLKKLRVKSPQLLKLLMGNNRIVVIIKEQDTVYLGEQE